MHHVPIARATDDAHNYVRRAINEVNLILTENCILGEWLVWAAFKSDSE